jgi:diguanylate cyclase (GGDEF)-like protein
MLRQLSDGLDQTGALRGALARAYDVLREPDLESQLGLIAGHLGELLDTSAVRVMQRDEDGWITPPGTVELPEAALAMEAALLPRALDAERSLLSSHPMLDRDLAELSARCSEAGCIAHVLLVRAHQATHAVFAAHWVGRERPEFERRFALYYYWDLVGLAVAAAAERGRIDRELEELRHAAYTDALTGLPNAIAFEQRLREHAATEPLSIAVLDFDGMREANAALGWEAGGDALIRAVGTALASLARPEEHPARLHTAGDEFALLLPGVDDHEARRRAREVEQALDALDLPAELHAVYRGASVGHATCRDRETPGQALARAVAAMRERKNTRASARLTQG